ncbi:MAG TPA: bifunctional transaldolase/phosoglucose isomerase [Methylomirabilota bacterium]|nr:bifunctional transaldolase/phosoglucose isomerase [Methylomirabilota bacterium]
MSESLNGFRASLPAELESAVKIVVSGWGAEDKVRRLWRGDATLWTGGDEDRWLGWLGIAADQLAHIDRLAQIADGVRCEGFTHALLLGMGGSSLGPEVLARTLGHVAGFPALHVLDATDPAQVLSFELRVDLRHTLCLVSSKSGTTLEPNIFMQYFLDRLKHVVGPEAGRRFVAITDPGSKLEQAAEAEGFRRVFFGLPTIGGRYSVLSDFGMVPAAITGVDVGRLLARAADMARRCGADVAPEDNPGVMLGAVLGVAAARGRDKVTLIASPALEALGAWLEQLLAESTGKAGRGLIPVDREPLGPPPVYGADRLFVYLRSRAAPEGVQDDAVAALEAVGQPIVRIDIEDVYDLGAEFFRWEFATAVVGAILAINPFDQPDVEASKVATRRLTDEYARTGALPAEAPFFEAAGLRFFADTRNAAALLEAARDRTVPALLRAHLTRANPGDYAAVLAYLEMSPAHEKTLQDVRRMIRDRCRIATCLGFGPRFLHSTGQAYKGGPNSGVFLQITCDDAADLRVPGQSYTFGVVKAAQARGDFEVLAERGRRALRVHLGADVPAGLDALRNAVEQALS